METSQHRTGLGPVLLLGGVITLGNFGNILHRSSRIYLYQQAQCNKYYQVDGAAAIEEKFCKTTIIQSRLSVIEGIDSFLQYLPPLLVLGLLKDLMERYGLRRMVVLNLCCSGAAVLYTITCFWLNRSWTTTAALLSYIFDLIGGGDMVRITIVCKCIADISPPKNLTNVFNYISGLYFVANLTGSTIGSLLLDNHVYILNFLSIACYLSTACLAVKIQPGFGRRKEASRSSNRLESPSEEDPLLSRRPDKIPESDESQYQHQPLHLLLLRSWRNSCIALLSLFSSPNPTFTVIILLLINGLAARISVITPQYISLAAGWPFSIVNRAMALKALISAASLFALPVMRKFILEPFYANKGGTTAIDLLITRLSLAVGTIGMIGLGFSAGTPVLIASLCVYTLATGLSDSLISFGTHTLPDDEDMAGFYVKTGLVNAVAALIGGPLWSTAMSLNLRHGQVPLGTPFWACAGLFAVGCAGAMMLRIESRPEIDS